MIDINEIFNNAVKAAVEEILANKLAELHSYIADKIESHENEYDHDYLNGFEEKVKDAVTSDDDECIRIAVREVLEDVRLSL